MLFGVLPYVAPEVLVGQPYTQTSDIYSFGALMSEISTGQLPFKDCSHDPMLAMDICNGLRSSFSDNTPRIYIELAWMLILVKYQLPKKFMILFFLGIKKLIRSLKKWIKYLFLMLRQQFTKMQSTQVKDWIS